MTRLSSVALFESRRLKLKLMSFDGSIYTRNWLFYFTRIEMDLTGIQYFEILIIELL